MTDTLLELIGMRIAPFSARGLTQTLEPIDQATQQRRNMNGTLIDLNDGTGFQKFVSEINCEDLQPPAFNGNWPGIIITVHCVRELAYKVPVPEEDPLGLAAIRPIVPGSLVTRNGWRYYRPILEMMITGFSSEIDEYGAATSWSLSLAEV